MDRDMRPHVGWPEQGGADGPVDGGAVRKSRAGVAEDGRAIERSGEVVAEVGVGGGDADGLAGFWCGAEDGGDDATVKPTGVDLLELQERPIFLRRGGGGHGNCTHAVPTDSPLVKI